MKSRNQNSIVKSLRKMSIFKRLLFSFVMILLLVLIPIIFIISNTFANELKDKLFENKSYYIENISNNAKNTVSKYNLVYDLIKENNLLQSYVSQNFELFPYIDDYVSQRIIYQQNKDNIYSTLSSYVIDDVESAYIVTGNEKYASFYPWFNNYSGMPQSIGFDKIYQSLTVNQRKFLIVENKDCFFKDFAKKVILIGKEEIDGHEVFIIIKFKDNILLNLLPQSNEEQIIIIRDFQGEDFLINCDNTSYLTNINDKSLIHSNHKAKFYDVDENYIIESNSNSMGFLVYNIVNKHVFLNSINDLIVSILVIILSAGIVAFYIAFVVTKSISNPLSRLVKDMQYASTSLQFEVDTTSNDEIAQVSKTAAFMVEQIKEITSKLVGKELEFHKEELIRKQYELNALQMQINPHFIYNTLELIRSEILYGDEFEKEKAGEMITEFAELLRIGTSKHQNIVKIAEELKHIELYLKVLGFSEYYKDLEYNVEKNIDVNYYYMTKFTLQPIIENSIKHGFAKNKKNKKIFLKIYKDINNIKIEIRDNGKGFSDEVVNKSKQSKSTNVVNGQIGLNNIIDRIKITFGNDCGITISNDEGALIVITLPQISATFLEEHNDV